MTIVTRFAPSPTGDLHLGHAYSAHYAHERARAAGGRFLVRIEDIDIGRCRDAYIERNLEDLRWLGLSWEEPPVRQSQRMALYAAAIDELKSLGAVYPCFCTRKEIREEIAAAGGAPHAKAPDGSVVYPGTCRRLDPPQREARLAAGHGYALRLSAERARALTGALSWTDRIRGTHAAGLTRHGDVVIGRKDFATSYHLAVVVDDAAQGVTEVTRGEDLLASTPIHRTLQALLGLPQPVWNHHALCRDERGERLSKRRGDTTLRTLRERGHAPEEVLAMARRALND